MGGEQALIGNFLPNPEMPRLLSSSLFESISRCEFFAIRSNSIDTAANIAAFFEDTYIYKTSVNKANCYFIRLVLQLRYSCVYSI